MRDVKEKLSKRYSKNDIILAIGRNKGVKTAICRDLDCTIHQLTNYLNIHSELKPLIAEAKKEIVSLAEETVLANLHSPNPQIAQRAAEFILKTLGKEEYSSEPNVQVNVLSDGDAKIQIQQIFGI